MAARRRWFWPALVAIALLAAAQATVSRLHHDLSVDEPFMALAIANPASILRALPDDDVPLAYALLFAWSSVFGSSALALRGLSIAAYAAACMFVGAAGRRAGGDGTGLLAALLVACSAIGLQHAATARPYALATLWAAMALWADVRADDRRDTWRALASVFVPHLLGLFTHPIFLFVSAASFAARILFPGKRRAIAWSPVAAVAVYAATWLWMLARTIQLPATSWMPRPTLRNFVAGYTHLWGLAAGVLLAGGAAVALAVIVSRRGGARTEGSAGRPDAVVRAALVAAAVLVGTFAVSQVRPLYLSTRTPVFLLPAAALALAWLLVESRLRALAPAAATIVIAASLTATVRSARAADPTPTRASLAVVARQATCGDIVVAAGVSYSAVLYHARPAGLPACVGIFPFPADIANHPGWPDMRPGFEARLREEAPSAAVQLPGAGRVWLFRSPGGLGLEAGAAISAELAKRRPIVQRLPLAGSFFEEIVLFGPAS